MINYENMMDILLESNASLSIGKKTFKRIMMNNVGGMAFDQLILFFFVPNAKDYNSEYFTDSKEHLIV